MPLGLGSEPTFPVTPLTRHVDYFRIARDSDGIRVGLSAPVGQFRNDHDAAVVSMGYFPPDPAVHIGEQLA